MSGSVEAGEVELERVWVRWGDISWEKGTSLRRDSWGVVDWGVFREAIVVVELEELGLEMVVGADCTAIEGWGRVVSDEVG